MPYRRSREIEQRLARVLRLVRAGGYSAPRLAEEIGVSVPTISRCIESLRDRGYDIRARRRGGGWCYVLGRTGRSERRREGRPSADAPQRDPDPMPSTATKAGGR
ncbi:HTH domain-containing protein [Tautonia sociabilis]|uniref:HTH domain-containing protein n=1 Tax=Tautonia sociabilis TaxID=2080755 RepID=A0A432MD26_9BACT|nr:HTH domain-containing protein [Tautonia sociabilis]